MRILLTLLLFFSCSYALEVKHCVISDQAKHEKNSKILAQILDEEIANISQFDGTIQSLYLFSRIDKIAKKLLERGFSQDAYQLPEINDHYIVSFTRLPVWEGGKNAKNNIPITFFFYLWPNEEYALKFLASSAVNSKYASIIHSHPIYCAFTVLDGSLVQRNFEEVDEKSRTVSLIDQEILHVGDGTFDDLRNSMIHQIVNKGDHPLAISLHAYGLPTAKKVVDSFYEEMPRCAYYNVLEKVAE